MVARRWSGLVAVLVLYAGIVAQRGFSALRSDPDVHNIPYDGRFTFTRLRYTVGAGGYYYRGLPAWAHGYPDAENNLLKIISSVSIFHPHLDGTNVLAIDDPELFRFPVSYMTEAGYWVITDKEAAALRKYLLKGGFLILDDSRDGRFPGNLGWANIEANFRRVLPGARFADLTPQHVVFHSFFDINSFDIVRQYYDAGRPIFRALYRDNDPSKRIMVLVNFNTDVSNYWEFSATGFRPVGEANEAYELGVDYILYALTH
ncbi:MAG: hypothetical protein JWM41_2191 [Gemmatimonadetes bacterium]|nr:hypothetical protein [Gemmatimonadota bacterium]